MSTTTFELSPELQRYGQELREWSAAALRPHARAADTNKKVPENWQDIIHSSPVPLGREDSDTDRLEPFKDGYWATQMSYYENLNYGDVWGLGLPGRGIGQLVVDAMGTPAQIKQWYDPVMEGKLETGFALTEPGFGSDTSQVATTAVQDGDSWVINGSKMYCTNGARADYITVFANADKSLGAKGIACFVVPRGTPGFSIAKENEDKLGIRSWQTSELLFQGCRVPLENRLGWNAAGAVDDGPQVSGQRGALTALANNRPNMAGIAVGLAQAAIDVTTKLLKEQQAGFSVQRWAAVERDLDAMNMAQERSRRINYKAAFVMDNGTPNKYNPAIAKGFAPQTCDRIIRRCMQLLGPEGTSKELLLEKWYRDVKIMDIFEGSGQVQRIIVARELVGRLAG
ncbi:acyl-CoA dehydrogenase family protein [Gordonia polyisoprenivorans]|uniref:acyl-CoA dehydrogenase family protein n=1 Tax=Gordonia polyisoprenivorans TaxID=84595 RepID=UPI001AD62276|nr:acyl-CoA dehydrogenase family protein [Gordonia polyisoprenivorans]QTI69923.1 acyl-CoA dehydrogenase family protein [Gordonia polyisoprenivorans]